MGFAIPFNTGTGKWGGHIFEYVCNIQVNNLLIKPIQSGVLPLRQQSVIFNSSYSYWQI